MDEAITLLREQAIICNKLLKLFAELSDLLKSNSPDTAESINKIESVVNELRDNLTKTQAFLGKFNMTSFAEFIDAQENNVRRDMAQRLLMQVSNLQTKLKRLTATINRLTINGRKFVEFNINVISQAATNTTYGSAAETGTRSNRRIFDANI